MMKYDMLTINTTSTVKTPNQEFTPKKSTAKNSTKHSRKNPPQDEASKTFPQKPIRQLHSS